MQNKKSLRGKKLLILGGSYQHRKIVRKAKEMGIITYVTDYLQVEDSPAKQMADYQFMYNITDIDDIIDLCKRERIDGVIAPYLDVTQWPYQIICEKMGYPCFGTAEQHRILTDKNVFKQFCLENGAEIIPSYTMKQALSGEIDYPVLVKPADSRGSRGQTVCFKKQDLLAALAEAEKESKSGGVIIEKYIQNAQDIQLAYLVIEGEPILYKVEDRYAGAVEDGLDRIAIACISPSKYECFYRDKFNANVVELIRRIGLWNSPVFIQAFIEEGAVRLYDPGIRMPGDDYDDGFKRLTGIDIPELLIRFALTGDMQSETAKQIKETRLTKYCAMILPCLKPGRIGRISGIEEIEKNPNIVTWSHAYEVGDEVCAEGTVKQRYGEFVIAANDVEELKETINWLFEVLHVYSEQNEDMLIAKFNSKCLDEYK